MSVKNRQLNASAALNAAMYAVLIWVSYTARSASLNLPGLMARDVYFMSLALQEAREAFDKGEVPVGAVLAVNDRVVVSTHNSKESSGDPTAHAELLAIQRGSIASGDWRLSDATLYVTKEPCVMCAGALINARVGRLVFGCRDERFGAVNSRHHLLHDPGLNHEVSVVSGVLEQECAEMLTHFFRIRRQQGVDRS